MDSFEKLNDTNYAVWSFKMKMLLIKEDLWDVVAGDENVAEGGNVAGAGRADGGAGADRADGGAGTGRADGGIGAGA